VVRQKQQLQGCARTLESSSRRAAFLSRQSPTRLAQPGTLVQIDNFFTKTNREPHPLFHSQGPAQLSPYAPYAQRVSKLHSILEDRLQVMLI
jgi:hypothetical protein